VARTVGSSVVAAVRVSCLGGFFADLRGLVVI